MARSFAALVEGVASTAAPLVSPMRDVIGIEVIGGSFVAAGLFGWSGDRAPGVAVTPFAVGAIVTGPGLIAHLLGSKRFRHAEPADGRTSSSPASPA